VSADSWSTLFVRIKLAGEKDKGISSGKGWRKSSENVFSREISGMRKFFCEKNFQRNFLENSKIFPDASQDRITFTLRPARVQISFRQSHVHDDGCGKTNTRIGL
jgi:hypothetical protein